MSATLVTTENDRTITLTATAAGQTVFPFDFPAQSATDLRVEVALAATPTAFADLSYAGGAFAVTGLGVEAGGSVTLATGRAVGDKVRISGDTAISRSGSVVAAGRFSSDAIDTDLDRSRMIEAELRRDVDAIGDVEAHAATAVAASAAAAGSASAAATSASLAGAAAVAAAATLAGVAHPLDVVYGAKGDGTTNDTASFSAYELVNSGRFVDLRGKTYVVSSIPMLNLYVNGYWKVSATTYDAAQNSTLLSSKSDTGGVGAAYTGGTYDTPTVPGRATDHLYALMASQGSRARGPARAAIVASIYSEAHGNVSANLAARQCNSWVPQSVNIASEESSVWGGFRGVNVAAFHSKCENESNANIATRDSSAASRNGVNIAASGGYVGRGGGWRGVVTVSGGAVTAVTTAVDGSTAQTGRGYQVGDPVLALDRQTGASNAVVAVATVDASGGILTCTVTSGGSGYGTTASPDGNYYIDAYVDNGTGDFSANVATSGYTEACGTGSGNFASSGASGQYGSVTGTNAAALGSSQHVVNADQAVAIAASGGSNTGAQSILTGTLNQVSATRAMVMGRRTINNQAGSFALGDNGSGSASTANRKIHLFGNGNIQAAGTLTGSVTFTDYAEMFENLAHGVIPLGTIVALSGRKVRPAVGGDEILGVVSATALVVAGDSPFTWAGRYLVGEFGEPLWDEIADPDWPIEIPDPSWPTRVPNPSPEWDDDGALCTSPTVPNPVPAPMISNPLAAPLVRVRRENPGFDPSYENTPRSERPAEWTVVGLLGQVHVRVGADVRPDDYVAADGSRSDAPTRLRCMEIRSPYNAGRGYAIAFCLIR